MRSHTELAFEDAIEAEMLAPEVGLTKVEPGEFDALQGLFPKQFAKFVQDTQIETWKRLAKVHGSGEKTEAALVRSLVQHRRKQGTLAVLRHGFKLSGQRLRCAYFRPAHGLNPENERLYGLNRVSVTRQVAFDPKSNQSIDLVVSLNGLPVATLELKNSLTGQTTVNAIKQYIKDRDPRLPLLQFESGALVHFAVDTDEVWMATKLARGNTFFLPFNKGCEGGAGNPSAAEGGYKTSYLWRDVLQRDSLLDLVLRFVHLEPGEEDPATGKKAPPKLIFPRYHQLDVVRKLEAAAREEGAGQHYLVQHSAGSGKSNSIAWVAHRLASLHDTNDRKVFDSVVVITDRRVLDKQLQDTIYQFEHKEGVVHRIDKHSSQLAEALEAGKPIIITTLQKFPYVQEKIAGLPGKRYAVIVDEAHSSQTGEAAQKLREVLGGSAEPSGELSQDEFGAEPPTFEDEIARVMASRGKQENLSFFAFTATPKAKTLEVFGRPGPDGKPSPFHLYSMRQAIEEKFILDVLRGYITYKVYRKLVTKSEQLPDETTVKKREAAAALARFVSLHPHNISQKVEVIVEHFLRKVKHRIGGKAKAMVVTRSRLHAVRYKLALDTYIAEKGYQGLGALVAFSGEVFDPDQGDMFTETGMNPGQQSEKELPTMFAGSEWQVLIVANKYQTGFDQPLLQAMYVDRRLAGVQAVQTLSRLNRTHRGKDDTFVLDFANEAGEIQEAFQPFFEATQVEEVTDPSQVDQLQADLDAGRIWQDSEIEAFCKVFYRREQREGDHSALYRYLQPTVDRFKAWEDEEEREDWRSKLAAFVRLYAFVSQVVPYPDPEAEMRYSFGRLLLRRLPRAERTRYDFEDDVDLHSYRLARQGEGDIILESGSDATVKGPTAVGTAGLEGPEVHLRELIETLNERFGTEFRPEDQLFIDNIVETAKTDENLQTKAVANTFDNFSLSVKSTVQDLMIDGMSRHNDLVTKYLNEDKFRDAIFGEVARRIYKEIHADRGAEQEEL